MPDTQTTSAPISTIPFVYRSAGDLEIQLDGLSRSSSPTLGAPHIGAFNSLLRQARALLPESVALREDIDEIDGTESVADVAQALKLTLLPALHNALPEEMQAR